MWSDPIDEVISQFGNVLDRVRAHALPLSVGEMDTLSRIHGQAVAQRATEQRTGKVGFAALEERRRG